MIENLVRSATTGKMYYARCHVTFTTYFDIDATNIILG